MRSQSYEFESNSQHKREKSMGVQRCLRSQSYEFESNSQLKPESTKVALSCLRSQSYEFESNSQLENTLGIITARLFEVTKLRI